MIAPSHRFIYYLFLHDSMMKLSFSYKVDVKQMCSDSNKLTLTFTHLDDISDNVVALILVFVSVSVGQINQRWIQGKVACFFGSN